MGNLRKEKSCSAITGLETIHQRLLDLIPSFATEYETDPHRQDFPANVVKNEKCGTAVLHFRLNPSSDRKEVWPWHFVSKAHIGTMYINIWPRRSSSPTTVLCGSGILRKYICAEYLQRRKPKETQSNIGWKLRPPNPMKGKMSTSQLQQFKSRIICSRCQKFGHWRQECPKRHYQPMNSVIINIIMKLGNS